MSKAYAAPDGIATLVDFKLHHYRLFLLIDSGFP